MICVGLTNPALRHLYKTGLRIDNGNAIVIAVFNGLLSLLTGKVTLNELPQNETFTPGTHSGKNMVGQ